MLKWSVVFLVLAVVAAIFGFGDIENTAAMIAQYIFFFFAALFFISLFAVEVKKHKRPN